MISFRSKWLEKEVANINGIVPVMGDNGWMSEDLTIKYLQSVIGRMAFPQRCLLIMVYRLYYNRAL